MLMATSRDVREIISKLSSEKTKTREEGIRLLNSWLEGEKSISLGCLLSKKTSSIQADEIPHEESWPFLLTLLTKCIALEISSNKRRPPKLLLAKTLRMAVQCAEDSKLSASQVPLLSVIKLLFTHIWEVVMSVPLFQLEYSGILRLLLSVDEYRCQMRSRIYSGLVLLYLNKLVSAVGLKCSIPSNSKEEEFRCASTLHVLLENPPGDFPDYIREDVVEAFTKIFSYIRDEGKFSRKLMECINSYLINDGPNLGDLATKIHTAIQDFLFRFWLTTHDRGLKVSFILYATVQLKFCRSDIEESALVDQLVDVVAKELDQCTSISIGMAWSDASRDDKLGPLGSLYQVLMELAAAVFYRSCKEGRNSLHQGKRLKMIDCIDRIKDGLMKGSWLWNCALCYLARIYGCRLDKSLLVYWLEAASESLQRLLNNPNTLHSYEALVWLLRALQQFSSLLLPPFEGCTQTPMKLDQVTMFAQKNWASIWMYLMQGIPAFSNVSPVVDVALTLLGNMVLRGQVGGAFVPHDMWDLRMFKHMSSSPALYFTACYFSTKGVQGDIRDAYYLRKNLLRAVLDLVNLKEPNLLTEQTILLIPAASYALATGCSYLFPFYNEVSIFSESPLLKEKLSLENYNQDILVAEVLECSVETLSILQINTPVKLNMKNHPGIRIPRQIHEPLLHEMEDYISGLVDSNEDIDKPVLGSQISCCSLLCNFVYCSLMARTREGKSICSNKLLINIVRLIDHIASAVDENCHEIHTRGSLFDASGSTFSSLLSFITGPFFGLIMDRKNADSELLGVFQSVEKLLVILGRSFSVISNLKFSHHSGTDAQTLQLPTFQESSSAVESTVRVVDIDLDADDGSKDADSITSHRSSSSIAYCYPVQHKLRFVALISAFSSVSPLLVWETLYDLLTSENDAKVSECILYSLCKYFPGSTVSISSVVNLLHDSLEHGAMKIPKCVTCVHLLLGNLLSRYSNSKNGNIDLSVEDMALEENFSLLGSLVEKISEIGLPFWAGRVKLIDCICNFVLLEPRIAQTLIGRLLGMLSDLDYRVRLFLARRLGILFLTWDGHNELFHDICSNFGVELVRASKDKVIKANGVLDHGVQSVLGIETAVITLAHLAYFSEKVEVKAVFMMCATAATFPVQRKLVSALLDGLSKHLQYDSRTKYLEELLGSILARWIDCEVSLTGLLEVQGLFFTSSDAQHFVRYCCPWLLPPLVLRGNIRSLELISEVAKQPLPLLVKEFFVPIFAVCMAVYCNGKADEGNSGKVLCESILQIAKISELERDDLIKKNMVSIVSFLLSLTTSSSDPEMPFFLDETVIICVQTIVDGFIEINNRPLNFCVVDKINIFRPDRVFKFLLEMHYQISAAIHPRHKCHRLSSIEVLIRIIGQRAVTSSTSNYIFSIVGHYIGIQHLQDQCCSIISTMLDIFKADSATETIHVLGEQLQFLVSKLVACCIPSGRGESATLPSRVIKLLFQLTMDADPLLYDFIKDLEPFPPLECLERVRIFHEDLCRTYSTRDRFLMFVRSSPHLPKELLLLSLQSLHEKLLMNDIIPHNRDVLEREWNNGWNCDSDIVNAVWNLFQLINTDDANDICGMLSDFVARIGIGDPYQVVFRLPDSSKHMHLYPSSFFFNSKEATFCPDVGISDDLLLDLLRLLKKYLVDDSVKTVDITVQTLQGILSTEKGQGALLALDSYERSVIEIHSKGVNLSLLEKVLLDFEKKHTSIDIELEDSSIWSTMGKSYEIWICLLVHKLAGLCDDVILRLCREIVLLKAEVAKLLFSSVLVNLAWNDDSDAHMRELISVKIRDNIFVECNGLAKSIQVVLDALNRLRSFYVADCAACFTTRQKSNRISSVSRSRYPFEKSKGHTSGTSMLCSLWPKVYWLSLDYLLVAKAAIHCGSYFTAILYIEHWCEERFNGLMLGAPDFSHMEGLPAYIELLIAAFTQINEPDAIYGVIQSHKLTSQLALFEHECNWSKALEYCDLLVRSVPVGETEHFPGRSSTKECLTYSAYGGRTANWKYCKGLMRSLQNIGSRHVLDLYSRGLVSKIGDSEHDWEFAELQYEAAWRAGNWDFSLFSPDVTYCSGESARGISFNENLHSCLRALQEGDFDHFHPKLVDTKKELVLSISNASWEAAEYIHSNISKLQILHHLGMAWELRWKSSSSKQDCLLKHVKKFSGPVIPLKEQLEWLNIEWNFILRQAQLQMKLLEPVIAFRRVMLQILDCKEFLLEDLLQEASTLRKGLRYSLATAALHELKFLFCQTDQERKSRTYTFGRLEEAKILRAQGQPDMAINLAKYLLQNYQMEEEASNIYRLIGKWLAETRSSNSRTILEKYLKHSVELLETGGSKDQKYISRQCQTFFQLAHYTDSLFKSYEERLASNEWQAALRLRKHKTKELEVLIRRMKSSTKGERTDYSVKIQELQKQLSMDREEAERLQDDRDNFLNLALEGYKRCLVIGGKYDLRVVFRIVSLWFSLHMRHNVVESMSSTAMEVQSYKFLPLVYQIASRLGISKEGEELISFQNALLFLVRKMAIEHPYHTIFQILALANGDRIKDKQRNKNSFVVDMDKKLAAENLLSELSSSHGAIIQQMKQMVEIYIKLAELETKKEDTNKKVPLPREIRSIRQLELVPVVTANIAIDPTCQYKEGTFPHFKGLGDSVKIMNGINVPKVVECLGSDGQIYRQLAKSGNDDLRQDAVMEQFFGIVNIFLQHHRDTWKRKLQIRTYKVVPFTPSAGLVEWVDRTIPLGEYLLGSSRNGGAHGRYGVGDWPFLQCRELMANDKDKRKAFLEVCKNFRPVMRYFFLERFLRPADWFERRLAYTRSVAASSMVGYIVGLGDRHSMNILIDEATAEVIHIDLGVAFEQGLMLKTPERVPFRLTRDIVDGMGVTGVEGVFRRCCEETLSVMRTNKEALLTIIEVFIHDPLYKWALSPLKALQRQKETNYDSDSSLESSEEACEGNRDAARAILRVKQKLDGYEDGEMRSVAGQVQQLIQDAIDTDRLCQMFPGWGAWL